MGRHSAPDDDADDADSAAIAVAAPPGYRPSPGRHSSSDDVDDEPDEPDHGGGLDLIENVLAGDAALDEPDDSTAKITPIADPILDEPVPAAMTTVIAPVEAEPVEPADWQPAEQSDWQPEWLPTKNGQSRPAPRKAAETESDQPAEPVAPEKATKTKRPEPRVSDRAILRADSAARARVIAAVVVPFVLYVVVLIVLGTLDLRTFLIWIWAPLITAGIVAGLILDLAHRAAATRAVTAAEEHPSTTG